MGKHLTYERRLAIKQMLDAGISVSKIAEKLECHRATIYNEINRGMSEEGYSPEKSESEVRSRDKNRGRRRVLEDNPELARYISDCILTKGMSPERIVDEIKSDIRFLGNTVSVKTIYNAIDANIIPDVSKESLNTKKVTMFSDGHIIIPKWIREKYGFNDGDKFDIEVNDDRTIKIKKIID